MLNIISDFLKNNILGALEDNINLFVYPAAYEKNTILVQKIVSGSSPINLFNDNQPILWSFYYFFSSKTDPFLFYNIFLIFTFFLNFSTTVWFFYRFLRNKYVSLFMSLLFNISGYFLYQYRSHIDLVQVWPTLIFLGIYLTMQFKHKYFVLGLLLALITGVSNYLAYIMLLFVFAHTFSSYLYGVIFHKPGYQKIARLKNFLIFISSYVLCVTLVLSGFLRQGFLERSNSIPTPSSFLNRSIEDFIIFSSRPWYYILPSIDNPFFGKYTDKIIDLLQNNWGYFLAFNYFKSEHSASYLGVINIILGLVGVKYLKHKISPSEREPYNILIFTAVLLFVITMPPLITLAGSEIHTPSFILFKLFPMFRVLARTGIYILLVLLVFTGYGYIWLLNYFNKLRQENAKNSTKLKIALLSIFISFSAMLAIMEFYIPPKITNVAGSKRISDSMNLSNSRFKNVLVFPEEKGYVAYLLFPYHGLRSIPAASDCTYMNNTEYEAYVINFDGSFQKSPCFHKLSNLGLLHLYNTITKEHNPTKKDALFYKVYDVVDYKTVEIYTLN